MNWLEGLWCITDCGLLELQQRLQIDKSKPLAYWDDDAPDRERARYQLVNGVAVIPVQGSILKRENWWTRNGYAVSSDGLQIALREALQDASVQNILLDIDSPGGMTSGTADCSDVIFHARGQKPIIALANDCCASAALWLGTSADRLYATQSSTIGSLGTKFVRLDATKAYEQMGLKFTVFQTGEAKSYGDPLTPLNDDERNWIRDVLTRCQNSFVSAIARNRGLSPAEVTSRYGDARVFLGQQAVDVGLADGITTLARLITELSEQTSTKGTANAGTHSRLDPSQPDPESRHGAAANASRSVGIRIARGH